MHVGSKQIVGLVSVLLVLSVSLLAQTASEPKPDAASKSIEFPHLTLDICESRGRKYRVSVEGDTAKIKSQPYEDFGGTVLCFDWEKLRSIEAFVRFKFGVLQYLFDDRPAKPLKFETDTGWAALQIENQSILIPQSYENFTGVTTLFEFLGYADQEAFLTEFERRNLGGFQTESLQLQSAFFRAALVPEERKRLEACCPEYIEQAERFLSNPGNLSTLEGLSLEPYRAKTTIELRGETKKGEQFVYQIIDEN